jgi:AcrR family transcriptional regulator
MSLRNLASAPQGREKLLRTRQRQKLIDACISALYLHGPSRTTIDKVVAIAKMSPGIVNFYFETKAALLVAALEHLAVEFEQRVQAPIEALRGDPAHALPRLIALYLDPDIASPRKVSVWYAFWGEASSRQEYQAICGKRDQAFADLVRDLMARLIARSGADHLNADAVALGLIGTLEMSWQDIAFREEADIDRAASRQRCQSYLESVFPASFGERIVAPAAPRRSGSGSGADPATLSASALLMAAELNMAGVPAFAMAHDWLGYHILARPVGGDVQRIVVVNTAAATNAVIECPQAGSFDWLAIIAFGEDSPRARRCFIVPAEMLSDGTFVRMQERGTIAIAVSKLMELGSPYIDNFQLIRVGGSV